MAKFYVVWHGRNTGIYNTWNECKAQVDGFPNARYKSFTRRQEAEAAFSNQQNTALNFPRKASPKKKVHTDIRKTDVSVFSDGGCLKNPGGGAGSGLAIYRYGRLDQLWYGLYLPCGTNNIAELNGLYQALIVAKKSLADGLSCQILTDSNYSLQAVTLWAKNWKKNAWQTKTGAVKNKALVEQCFNLYTALNEQVKVQHVAAHVNIEGNELADRMATLAMTRKEVEFVRYTDYDSVEDVLALT